MSRFRVKELAGARGLTAEELSKLSGVKVTTIQKLYRTKTRDAAYSTLAPLARALGVSVDELVETEYVDGQMNGHTNGDGQINRAPELQSLAA